MDVLSFPPLQPSVYERSKQLSAASQHPLQTIPASYNAIDALVDHRLWPITAHCSVFEIFCTMNTFRTQQLLRLGANRQILTRTTRRNLSIEPQAPPPEPPKQPSKVGAFYKSFSAPILKCFLGALFTYQLAYFGWMKLETIEEVRNQKTEIKGLQEQLAGAMNTKRREAEGVVEEVKDKVVEGAEAAGVAGKVKKGGWWPW